MARNAAPENMSLAELTEYGARLDRLIDQKKGEAKAELRGKLVEMAKDHGMTLDDVLGGRKSERSNGVVPIKYRDPSNPANTWTGRGRTPRWMVAAMKGKKAKKEDFLI
jgi:DNA-binding protein H-NS